MLPIRFVFLFLFFAAQGAHAQSVLKSHDTYQPIDVTAERMEVKDREGRAILIGSVEVKQGGMTLLADTLTIYYESEEASDNPTIRRLDASGNVRLVSDTEQVTGDWSVYDVDRRLVTFGGNVQIVRPDTTLNGERLELDLVSGLLKVDGRSEEDGRVRGRFSVPENDNGGG